MGDLKELEFRLDEIDSTIKKLKDERHNVRISLLKLRSDEYMLSVEKYFEEQSQNIKIVSDKEMKRIDKKIERINQTNLERLSDIELQRVYEKLNTLERKLEIRKRDIDNTISRSLHGKFMTEKQLYRLKQNYPRLKFAKYPVILSIKVYLVDYIDVSTYIQHIDWDTPHWDNLVIHPSKKMMSDEEREESRLTELQKIICGTPVPDLFKNNKLYSIKHIIDKSSDNLNYEREDYLKLYYVYLKP